MTPSEIAAQLGIKNSDVRVIEPVEKYHGAIEARIKGKCWQVQLCGDWMDGVEAIRRAAG